MKTEEKEGNGDGMAGWKLGSRRKPEEAEEAFAQCDGVNVKVVEWPSESSAAVQERQMDRDSWGLGGGL